MDQTYQRFFKKLCGRPGRKKKTDRGSIHLTRELFRFEKGDGGVTRLFIGTKTNNIGHLECKAHRKFGIPNSIRIVKDAGKWFVSFSFETDEVPAETEIPVFANDQAKLDWLRSKDREWLEANINGHDRGSTIPVHSPTEAFDFSPEQKKSKDRAEERGNGLQRKLSRQQKGSRRRQKTKERIAVQNAKKRNIRRDFGHKTSRKIVDGPALINVFENLKLKNMTKRPKAKKDENGKFIKNGAAAKAALNKGLLEPGLGQIVEFTRYKSARAGKLLFLVAPHYTSQECACCGHVDADNRRTQALFECTACGHRDNADHNAGVVIGKRAVTLLLDPGTGLSDRGVLSTVADYRRGAADKTYTAISAVDARGEEASKEKPQASFHLEAA
ncbi:transposase [Rhizobium sp. BK176]|uniref:RNA-guided endonuclease InsQ/TnpB family protein n=1 Tax=Rhizobium sp. BK176 TaxID=2587071 RepID=UPI002168FEE4|nr:transposase [Rhizobium sp. BK176]MCS4089412.1 putative transposase [Rhizobium sp. BK176]